MATLWRFLFSAAYSSWTNVITPFIFPYILVYFVALGTCNLCLYWYICVCTSCTSFEWIKNQIEPTNFVGSPSLGCTMSTGVVELWRIPLPLGVDPTERFFLIVAAEQMLVGIRGISVPVPTLLWVRLLWSAYHKKGTRVLQEIQDE